MASSGKMDSIDRLLSIETNIERLKVPILCISLFFHLVDVQILYNRLFLFDIFFLALFTSYVNRWKENICICFVLEKRKKKKQHDIVGDKPHRLRKLFFCNCYRHWRQQWREEERKKKTLWYLSDGLAEPYKNRIISLWWHPPYLLLT